MSYLSDLLGTAYKEGMTEDEISNALEAASQGDETEINRLKAALSKANSQAANYKKQLREKQSDDEAAAAAQQEELDRLMQENAELKRSKELSEKKTKLLAQGYDEDLADKTAIAMVDGDMDTVLANQSIYLETQKKAIQTDLMRNTPRPVSGAEQADSMDYAKMIADAQANGDFSTAAYYTRLQAQDTANLTNTE